MANAFRAAGAGAVVGFLAAANTNKYTGPLIQTIIGELYKEKTIQEAVAVAKASYEYMEYRGKGDLRLSGKLKNTGFESGALASWSKEGDGRVIPHLGDTGSIEGDYMAIISTGLGYTTTSGSIKQDFCMASDAKKLGFDWNFFSEEFKEYCGSIYQDSFSVKMSVLNLSNGATESETLLFTRKIDDLCGMVHEADVHFDQSGEACQPTRLAIPNYNSNQASSACATTT
jgi:hypothetical protein